MKNVVILLLFIFMPFSLLAQDITGQWHGVLNVPGVKLRVVFNIMKTDNGYNSTMDSPDQGVQGIPVTTTSFENSKLSLQIPGAGIEYTGEFKDSIIIGIFKQRGQSFPMNFSREEVKKVSIIKEQEPVKPLPYISEDIHFVNTKANIALAGTFTFPKNGTKFPAVILISGSGPQNRDEEILGHKPFLVLSDHLTRNGIAVLRYDDRGTSESKGDFKSSTTIDFASDVESAIEYLKSRQEIDWQKIGLIGHSEGGMIAPIVAGKSRDIKFIVLLAAPGIPGDQLLLLQQQLIGKASGASEEQLKKTISVNKPAFDIVKKATNTEILKSDLRTYMHQTLKDNRIPNKSSDLKEENFINLQVEQLSSPWMQYFIKYDPAKYLEKVRCPVLAINGSKDLQVPSKINLQAIKEALKTGGNDKVSIVELENLNHLFQESITGLPDEYSKLEQTFSPIALREILNWIKVQIQK